MRQPRLVKKAISSEMFFERGVYDLATVAEGRAQLAQFQGATSISSNQYFGRDEKDMVAQGSYGGFLGDDSLSRFESAAREAVIRIKANSDVQNLGESLCSGALKVCDPSLMQRGDTRRTNASCCVTQLSDYALVLGSSRRICGWNEGEKTDEGVLFSSGICHPCLDGSVPDQLRDVNLTHPDPRVSDLPFHIRGARTM